MNKFWEWMKEKGYNCVSEGEWNGGWGHIIPEDDLGLPGCWNYEALRIAINILDKEG